MREILFKAKRIDDGEWVEGSLVNISEDDFRIVTEDDCASAYISNGLFDGWMDDIEPDTICQYTGLTDKNGNKIWENDILFAKEPYIPTCPFSIRYNQETISYVGLYDGFGKSFELSKELLSCSEVIGNIFDNPELKEGAE